MARRQSKPKRKKPAYPKPGTGEDFPARRPGTKVRETRSGQKVMQSTRASQARTAKARKYVADPLPTDARGQIQAKPYSGRKPTGKREYPFSHGVRGKATKKNPWPL